MIPHRGKVLDASLPLELVALGCATLDLLLEPFAWHRREARYSKGLSLWSLLILGVQLKSSNLNYSHGIAESHGLQYASLSETRRS
jgi:hypothetical protein